MFRGQMLRVEYIKVECIKAFDALRLGDRFRGSVSQFGFAGWSYPDAALIQLNNAQTSYEPRAIAQDITTVQTLAERARNFDFHGQFC